MIKFKQIRLCYKCRKPVIDVEFGDEEFAICTNEECERFGLMSLVAYESKKKDEK
jgi:hypothetical protein